MRTRGASPSWSRRARLAGREHYLPEPARLEQGRDLPDDYDVTISYEDPLGNEYEETMTVGYSHRRDMVYRERYDISDIHKRLKEIRDEMKKFRRSGVKVITPASARADDRRADETWDERARGRQEAENPPGADPS